MSTQQSHKHVPPISDFSFDMASAQAAFAPMNYSFDPSIPPNYAYDAYPGQTSMVESPIMWGGMQQLSLDKKMSQNWQNRNDLNDMFNQQLAAAHHISQYGQITPPNDDDPGANLMKLEEEMSQHQNDDRLVDEVQRIETKPKRAATKRRSKGKDAAQPQGQKKSTRKARKGYKATTQEEEDDSDGEVKRERFLERNRVAASKCRQKKKQWTSGLESHARDLAAANAHLNAAALSLKEEVLLLKSECLKHTDCSCSRIREYLDRSIAGMNPSGVLQTMPESGSRAPNYRKDSQGSASVYTFDSATPPTDAASISGDSNQGSPGAESLASVQMQHSNPGVDQDMQALLEASIATPGGGGGRHGRVG